MGTQIDPFDHGLGRTQSAQNRTAGAADIEQATAFESEGLDNPASVVTLSVAKVQVVESRPLMFFVVLAVIIDGR